MSRLYPRCSSFDCTGRYTRLDSTVEIYILGTILSINMRIVYLNILLGSIFKVYFNLSQVFFNHPVSHFTTLQHEVTHDQSQIVLLCTWPMVLPMQRVSQIVRYFTMLQHELINDQSQSFLLRTSNRTYRLSPKCIVGRICIIFEISDMVYEKVFVF